MDVMKHGGDIIRYSQEYGWKRGEMIDFSANINPLGPPPSVMQALREQLEQIVDYPDSEYRQLRNQIAQRWHIGEDCVCIGNGAAELIFLVMRALQPKNLLTVAPTFREYEQAARLEGAKVHKVPLVMEEDARFPVGRFLEAIPHRDLIVLANPNNPTGSCLPQEALQLILETAYRHHVYVLLDEAFLDFVENERERSLISQVQTYPNLIVLRSMTKFYAIPGLRIGYACTNPELVANMLHYQVPWSVNTLAQVAALQALSDEAFHQQTLRWLKDEKKFLQDELRERGYHVFPTDTNFMLVYHPLFDMESEWKRMAKLGLFIRDCRSFDQLDARYFRTAIRTREENQRLLQGLPVFTPAGAVADKGCSL